MRDSTCQHNKLTENRYKLKSHSIEWLFLNILIMKLYTPKNHRANQTISTSVGDITFNDMCIAEVDEEQALELIRIDPSIEEYDPKKLELEKKKREAIVKKLEKDNPKGASDSKTITSLKETIRRVVNEKNVLDAKFTELSIENKNLVARNEELDGGTYLIELDKLKKEIRELKIRTGDIVETTTVAATTTSEVTTTDTSTTTSAMTTTVAPLSEKEALMDMLLKELHTLAKATGKPYSEYGKMKKEDLVDWLLKNAN